MSMEYHIALIVMDPHLPDHMQNQCGYKDIGLGMVHTGDGFLGAGEGSKILITVYKNRFLHIVTGI